MTDRREQWLRTLRQPYHAFPIRFPVPARRLQESRTWPRIGPTARIASTVVHAAGRRKEEKEEGELSSSDDEDASPSLKLTGASRGKGYRSSYSPSSRSTQKEQQRRPYSRSTEKIKQPLPKDVGRSPVSTTLQSSRLSSIGDKSQLLSSVCAPAPLITASAAAVSVARISSELAAGNATSAGPQDSTVVPDVQVQNQATEQTQHIHPKLISEPAQSSIPSEENAIANTEWSDLAKAHKSSPSTSSPSVKAGGAYIQKSFVSASGKYIDEGQLPVKEDALVQNGPASTAVGTDLADSIPSPVSSALPARSSCLLTLKDPLISRDTPTSVATTLPAVGCQASVEARSLPAHGGASAFPNSTVRRHTSEARSSPAQGASSASLNSGGNTLPTGIPARKEAESFLASLRIPLSPAAMCNLPAVEDKDDAFVINFDDSSESDGPNRIGGAVFNRGNNITAGRTANQPVQGSSYPGGQQISNGAPVPQPAMLQSQIDQMKKQIAAMEQKGKPPLATNPSKLSKSSYSAVHRQPHYVAGAPNGDGGKLESLRQTILQKENELEKERQRLGQISQAPRRSANTTVGVGRAGNASSLISPQKFRDASAGNSGGQHGRVGIPYLPVPSSHPVYTNIGGQTASLKPHNPSDFEQRGPAGTVMTSSWMSQKLTAAPKLTSSELPLNNTTAAAKQKRARAEKLAHDIKRLEAQIFGSPKVHQAMKRKQGAASMTNNIQDSRLGFISQARMGRLDAKRPRRNNLYLEPFGTEDCRLQNEIGTAGLWTSTYHLQESRHTASGNRRVGVRTGFNPRLLETTGGLHTVFSEPNTMTHSSEQGLEEPNMTHLTSEGLKMQTRCSSEGFEGEVYSTGPMLRAAVRAQETYCPKFTEACAMETVLSHTQGEQLQFRGAPCSQVSLDPVGDKNVLNSDLSGDSRKGQGIGTHYHQANMVHDERQISMMTDGIGPIGDVHSNCQEDFMNLQQEEESIDNELEEAQERRRVCERQERVARKAYREAQRALQAVNIRCDYLHQRRESVAAQVRAAEIQHYSARALLQPPQTLHEGTVVSFDKDLSAKAPFFYSAPSTWTRAEPSIHQAVSLLPRMGSMVGHQFSGHENLHAGNSHHNYAGIGVARPRESAQLQPFSDTPLHRQDLGVTKEVRSVVGLPTTNQSHGFLPSTGLLTQKAINGTNTCGRDSVSPIVDSTVATEDATMPHEYERRKMSEITMAVAEGLASTSKLMRTTVSEGIAHVHSASQLMRPAVLDGLRNVLSTSQLLRNICAESGDAAFRPETQVQIPGESLNLLSQHKVSEPSVAPELATVDFSRQQQGYIIEMDVEGQAVDPMQSAVHNIPDLLIEVVLSDTLAIPAQNDSAGDKGVPTHQAPCLVEHEGVEPQHHSPITPIDRALHMSKKLKNRTRQRGGRTFQSVKVRRVPHKFRSASSSESPIGPKLSLAPDESESQAASASDCVPMASPKLMVCSQTSSVFGNESSLVAMQDERLCTDLEITPGEMELDIDRQPEKFDEMTCLMHTDPAQLQPVSGVDDHPCPVIVDIDTGVIDGNQSVADGNGEPVVVSNALPKETSTLQDLSNELGTACLVKCQHVEECVEQDAMTSSSGDSVVDAACLEQKEDVSEVAQNSIFQTVPHDSIRASASESRNLDLEVERIGLVDVPNDQDLSFRTSVVSDRQCEDYNIGEGAVGGDNYGNPLVECSDAKGLDVTEMNDPDTKALETSCGTQVLEDDIFVGSSASTEMLAGHASDVCMETAKHQIISDLHPAMSDYLIISVFRGVLDLYVPSSALLVTFSCCMRGNEPLPIDCATVALQSISAKGLRKASEVPWHQHPLYKSPLRNFRSYRLFPWFNHSLESSTWSHAIDYFKPLCKFEHRGVCKDQECPLQHIRDYKLNFNQILSQLDGYIDAKMVSSMGAGHTGGLHNPVEEHDASESNPHSEASVIVAKAQEFGCSVMKPIRCQSWNWTSYVGHVPAYRMGSHLFKSDDAAVKGPPKLRALAFSAHGTFQSYLLSPSASRPLPVNVPFLFETGEKRGLFEKLVVNTPRWFDLADGTEKQALAEGEPNDVELWLEVALDLINFDITLDEPDKKASALFLLSRALEANSSSAVLWIVYLSIFYTKNGTEKDDLFKPAVDHSNCYELWQLFIDTRSELNERLESYETALTRLGAHDENSLEKQNSSYLLDLALQMLYCMNTSGKIEMAVSWMDRLVFYTSADSPPSVNSSTSAVLTGLTLHDACILWVCCAYISAYSQLPASIISRFGCRQELPFNLHWKNQQVEAVDRLTRLLKTAASAGLGCLMLDTVASSDDEANRARQAFAVNYVQCLAVSSGVDTAVLTGHHFLSLWPGCLELVVTCARFEQQLRGTERGLGVFQDAVNRLEGTSGVLCLWNQYAGHALRWEGKDAALEVLGRCAVCDQQAHNCKDGSSSSSISDSTVDACAKNCGNMQQIRACLSAISGRHLSTWVENAKGNRILPGQDSVFSLLNLGLFEVLYGDMSAAQVAIEAALKTSANDKDAEHCWKELASFTIFNLGKDNPMGDTCLLGQHMLDLLDRCFTEARLISKLESLSQLAEKIKKRRVRSFVKNLLGASPVSYCLLNDILYATYGPTILPGTSSSFQSVASFVEGILEIMPGNVVVALALCRLIVKVYDESTSVSADAATVWASSLVAHGLVKSNPRAPEIQWLEAANFLRRTGESDALQEFCQHALKAYPFSVALGKFLEAS